MQHRKYQWRSFITFFVVFSFVILAVTGIVLYVTPPGRIANWTGWRLIGLTKTQWQSVHTIHSFLFVVAAAFHLAFNWRVLTGYLRVKVHAGMKKKWEFIGSVGALGLVFFASVRDLTPASLVMDAGEDLKNSWEERNLAPPIPHAELLTLREYAEKAHVPMQALEKNLEARGITHADAGEKIGDIAGRTGLAPMDLVHDAAARPRQAEGKPRIGEGGGYGRKTVEEICVQYRVETGTALDRLRGHSIEGSAEEKIIEIAGRAGKRPIEIVRIIAGEG